MLKKVFWALSPSMITIVGGVLIWMFVPHTVHTQVQQPPRPRFEMIYHEGDTDGPAVWRDKETGQEIVCFAGGGVQQNPSCWLTGRKW
jgi:hypothetical protein